MSYDFLEDALDILRKDGYGYVIIAAKTPMYLSGYENIKREDVEAVLEHMEIVMENLIEHFGLQDLYYDEDEDYDEDDFYK